MAFDPSKYRHDELKTAFKVFSDMVDGLSAARLQTMQQLVRDNDLTQQESHRLALEIGTYEVIKETLREELELKEVDEADEDEG